MGAEKELVLPVADWSWGLSRRRLCVMVPTPAHAPQHGKSNYIQASLDSAVIAGIRARSRGSSHVLRSMMHQLEQSWSAPRKLQHQQGSGTLLAIISRESFDWMANMLCD